MPSTRTFIGGFVMALIVCAIGYIFWHQEMQYWLPTPVPPNLKRVAMGDEVDLHSLARKSPSKPLFLHFYNFDCPCSRFNVAEFESMYNGYRNQIEFVAVVQSSEPSDDLKERFQDLMGVAITTVVDKEGELAKSLGIYSTPQAVLITPDNKVFYKGNYNASRYCTSKSTRFAEMALEDVLAGENAPRFAGDYPDLPYGCLIPAYESPVLSLGSAQ